MLSIARISPACLFLATVTSLGVPSVTAQQQPQVKYSAAHRNSEHALPQALTGGTKATRAALAASRSGISLTTADFDKDGTKDLITGYATAGGGALVLQRGAAVALAPTPDLWPALSRGEFVSPFAAKSEVIDLPVQPDLLQTADVTGHGYADVLVAAKGGQAVYLLAGAGNGTFAAAKALPLNGAVSALATWHYRGENLIAAAVCGASGCGLQVLGADGTTRGFVPMAGRISSIEMAGINRGPVEDMLVVADGKASIVDGESVLSGSAVIDALPVGDAVAATAGAFIYSYRSTGQIAVLGADATLHILSREPLNPQQISHEDVQASRRNQTARAAVTKLTGMPWIEVESTPSFGPGSANPVLIHGHFSGSGQDDVVLMAGGQYVQLSHFSESAGAVRQTTAYVTLDSTSSPIVAALATRVSASGRVGVVTANGTFQPYVSQPGVNRTITVNTTSDAVVTAAAQTACKNSTAGCTLRAAVSVSNADTGTTGFNTKEDVINVPPGNYSLTANNGSTYDTYGSINIHLDIDATTSLVGAGTSSTVITAGSADKAISADSGVVNANAPYEIFISGVTLTGTNANVASSTTCNYNCDYFGGALDWDSAGTGNLTMNSVVVTGSRVMYATGGGLYVSDFFGTSIGAGTFEIDNSTVSNNVTPEIGGGIFIGADTPFIINTVSFTGNQANPSVNTSDTARSGQGGAIGTSGADTAGDAGTITNSTFYSNTATLNGGALFMQDGGFTLTGSILTSNTASQKGGGMFYATSDANDLTGTVTASTFTSNTGTVDGGGICYETDTAARPNTLTMHYSRIHGNTSNAITGLSVGRGTVASSAGTANVTDNWWGCNAAPTAAPCDVAALSSGTGSTTLTTTPYTKLTLALNASTVNAGSAITATASLGQDSAGTVYTAANDTAYLATPITTFTLTNAGTVTYTPSATAFSSTAATGTSFAAARATGTAASNGVATLTVDGVTVTQSYTVIPPPDLSVTSTHSGNFTAGSTGNTYTLTVANIGSSSTSGTVTVVDTLPSGFTATAISGSGWTCTLATLTCTSSAVVAASVTFPAITLTVTAPTSVGSYTNSVAVSGGGETNTSNDTGTDATNVVPGSAASLVVTGLSTFTAPQMSGTATVRAVDAYGDTATGFTGTVTLSSTDSTATFSPASYTFAAGDAGVHTFTVTFNTAGTFSVTATSGAATGSQTGILVQDSILILNTNSTVVRTSDAGTQLATGGTSSGTATYGAVAFDNAGDIFTVSNASGGLQEFTKAGVAVAVSGSSAAGVSAPVSLFIDGIGRVWVANGNSTISVVSAAGAAVTPSTGYTGGIANPLVTPSGIIVDNAGSVWVTNRTGNSVTKFFGAAAPVTTPTVTGTTNNTLGARP